MRKLSGFSVVLACLLALGLAFVSCQGPVSVGGTPTYTVTFHANGGGGTAPSAQTVSSGSSITHPSGNGLTMSGYTFGGWNTNADGTGTNYSAGESFTHSSDIVLYAKWVEVAAYTVRELTIAMWDSVSDGWDSSAALRINVNGTDRTTNAGLASGGGPGYYRFDVNSGDIVQIYWVNGGQFDSEIAFAVYYSNDPPSPVFNPSTGTSDTARVLVSKLYNNPSGAVGNGTSMGSFTVGSTAAVYYTVTFDLNGGNGTPPSEQTIQAGSSVYIYYSSLTRDGYTFGGWNTEPDGTGTDYQQGGYFNFTPNSNITLYARWYDAAATLYTVTFDLNGGNGTPLSEQTIQAGSGVYIYYSYLTRDGYTFSGWNTEPDGTGTNYETNTYFTPDGNITLYAKWDAIYYTVTFYTSGGDGTVPGQITVQAGSSITIPDGNGLTMSGYAFAGWNSYYYYELGTYQPGDTFTPAYDITLYAKWNAIGETRIEYYWIDQHGNLTTTSGGAITVAAGQTLAISAQWGNDYVVKQWRLDGVTTGQSGNTYYFSSRAAGKHTVGLFIEKNGKLYNTNITITVVVQQ